MPRADGEGAAPTPVVASVDESVAVMPVAAPTPAAAAAAVAVPVATPAPMAASVATVQPGHPSTVGKAAAPQPAPAVVMAREIPTTKKGPGSREAIVIGMANNPNKFQTTMMDAPCADPGYFLFGCLCPCCAACHLRKKMLGDNFETEYSCCQMESVGFQPCCYSYCSCFKDCPDVGLCLEAWCCTGISLSFTRIHAMHKWQLQPDPMDYTCIQFSNCMQVLRCVCDVLAMFNRSFEHAAHCVDCAADCAFHVTAGCMLAQTNHEINFRATAPSAGVAVPVASDGQPVLQATVQPASANSSSTAPLTQTLLPGVVDMER
jgi:hypothetical protein